MVHEYTVDYLVVGAGPSGLQMGYLLEKAGRDYLMVEKGPGAGTFFTRFPRHRTLISNNKVHSGWSDPEMRLRVDWNSLLTDERAPLFTTYSPKYFPAADDYVRYLNDFATTHDLKIRYDTRISEISKADGFTARDQHGNTYRANKVIMSAGVTKPYIPDFDGAQLADAYPDVSVDPEGFTDQKVLIVGRGNSAFETADNLIEHAAVIHVAGPGSLKLAWQTHFVGHLRAVNNNFLDSYQLKSENALLDGYVKSIRRDDDGYWVKVAFQRVNEIVKEIRYDRVILATGFRFDPEIFEPGSRPQMTIKGRFPDQTDAWESVNIPGLYFTGTVTQMRDFKKSTSGFIHGFRYGAKALHRILEQRHHGVAWPSTTVEPSPEAVCDAIIARVNRTSALWQMFAFLADVVFVGRDGAVRYAEEIPVDHLRAAVPAGEFGDVDTYLQVTLEYGADHDKVNPFDISTQRPSQHNATGLDGRYLHPVVRVYRDGQLSAEHHLTENLDNAWDSEDVHRAPLRTFLKGQLDAAAVAS
ncbi:MAG TPA: NAD(P)-binding domain-containing protein [Stackebrandtia sp.]|uniref:NAD(P)-binding domain-containing protein n=1 Tax=Stackebrandtia sp. TaxID=2023065 RepID=UPI002D4C7360|nr:NAD(P)-binding domain-containing protein [Stackebrandtia sp.]HZE37551.1 NAD(P)-binding domain-containing protein [Stackebrandtia sp.]